MPTCCCRRESLRRGFLAVFLEVCGFGCCLQKAKALANVAHIDQHWLPS